MYGTGLAEKLIISGQKIISHDPLVLMENIYSPPLHMKFGLMKEFVRVLDKAEDGLIFQKLYFLVLGCVVGLRLIFRM